MHPRTLTTPRRLLLGLGLLLSTLAGAAPAPEITAPQVEAPTHVLFVGNSYYYYGNSVHNHVRRLVDAANPGFEARAKYKSATIGGASLDHHAIEHLTEPGKIGVKEPFQLVILQGGSAEPLAPARAAKFRDTVVAFDKVIKARGGKTALYLTQSYVAPHKQAKPENARLTEELYVSVGNQIGALVIPVGPAFDEAYKRKPDMRLHQEYDGSHPNQAGTYLAACVVFASVYGQSPVGNAYDYHGRIDKDTAAFLQQVAVDTVKAFYGR